LFLSHRIPKKYQTRNGFVVSALVTALNGTGRYTLMCGDGTNDVGALKQSHIVISLISVPEIEAKQHSATEVVLSLRRKKEVLMTLHPRRKKMKRAV